MPQTDKSKLVILVVDDDAIIAMNTVDMVEALGHTVFEAHSGERALAILKSQPVDVLITDQSMPGMTGLELAAAARAHVPHLPVLLASGYGEGDLQELDRVTLLGKPFDERMLAARLESILAEQPPA